MFEVCKYTNGVVTVEAVRLALHNVRAVALWMRDMGGAVAGLRYVDAGPIGQRSITVGTVNGDTRTAPSGMWVIHWGGGHFEFVDDHLFMTSYEPA